MNSASITIKPPLILYISLLTISAFSLLTHLIEKNNAEHKYPSTQKYFLEYLNSVYYGQTVRVSMWKQVMIPLCLAIALFSMNRLRHFLRNDYFFTIVFCTMYCGIIQLPAAKMAQNIEIGFGHNRMQPKIFWKESIITWFTELFCVLVFLRLTRGFAKYTNLISSEATQSPSFALDVSDSEDSDDNSSFSFLWHREYIFGFFIFGVLLAGLILRSFMHEEPFLIYHPPQSRLAGAISKIDQLFGINLGTVKMLGDSTHNSVVRFFNEGLFGKRAVVSDTLSYLFTEEEIIPILLHLFYTKTRNEIPIEFIFSLVEIAVFALISGYLAVRCFPVMMTKKRHPIALMLLVALAFFYVFQFATRPLKRYCLGRVVIASDSFTAKMSHSIAPTLTKMYTSNAKLAEPTHLFRSFFVPELTLQERLSQLAN